MPPRDSHELTSEVITNEQMRRKTHRADEANRATLPTLRHLAAGASANRPPLTNPTQLTHDELLHF